MALQWRYSATILPAPGALRGVGYDSDTLRQQGAVGGKEISNKYMLCAAVGLIARLCEALRSPLDLAVEYA